MKRAFSEHVFTNAAVKKQKTRRVDDDVRDVKNCKKTPTKKETPSIDTKEKTPSIDTKEKTPSIDTEEKTPSIDTEEKTPSIDTEEDTTSIDTEEDTTSIDTEEDTTDDKTSDDFEDITQEMCAHKNTADESEYCILAACFMCGCEINIHSQVCGRCARRL